MSPDGEKLIRQKRGQRIAMTPDELDEFLRSERVCRLATISVHGPHVGPVWFVWEAGSVWVSSLNRSQRFVDLERDPRASLVVDAGVEYTELRGVELRCRSSVVGEVPRAGLPNAELEQVERLWARKYLGADEIPHDGRHAWLRLQPLKITSWDFRKL